MEFSLSEFEPVGDRVHVAVAEPEGVNVGLVVGSTGALLVDTGSSPSRAAPSGPRPKPWPGAWPGASP